MPTITIQAFKRSQEQKERLAKAITEDVCQIFNVTENQVSIYFEDRVKSDLFRGGIPATEWK